MSEDVYKKIIPIFAEELQERIQEITEELLALEGVTDKEVSFEKVNSIFRAAHNIKGSAYSISLNDIAIIAHHIEELFSEFRKGNHILTPEVSALCLFALDAMTDIMKDVLNATPVTCNVTGIIDSLKEACRNLSQPTENTPQPAPTEKISRQENKFTLSTSKASSAKEVLQEEKAPIQTQESIRVTVKKLMQVNAISDELLQIKLKNSELVKKMKSLESHAKNLLEKWRDTRIYNSIKRKTSIDGDNLDIYVEINKQIATLENMLSETCHVMKDNILEFGYIADTLQENMRDLRLVPIGSILRPLFRTVHDISKELGKEVELVLIGEDIEVDRAILEEIKSPVMHLLRNAIDHGIETGPIRQEKGKPEKGNIMIKVTEEAGQVKVVIRDDGRGMQEKEIIQTAIAKNIITAIDVPRLTKEEILNLATAPGFSTKKIITNISGRGVGLDVVQTCMQSIKGSLALQSQEEKGTSITLRFPLTIITERGMLIKTNGQHYVIPTTAIKKIVSLSENNVKSIEGGFAFLEDYKPLTICDLAELLNPLYKKGRKKIANYGVIIEKSLRTVVFLVDEVLGEREIVIKSLLPPLSKTKFINGGYISSSGKVVLVLNPKDLVEDALKRGVLESTSTKVSKDTSNSNIHLLVVDDSITTRGLETSILMSQGYIVSAAADGEEAWYILQKEPIDLVITDVEMPRMDGFALTEKIRKDDKLKELPVIIVTTHDSTEDKRRGIEVEANAYILKKEFHAHLLIDLIKQLA